MPHFGLMDEKTLGSVSGPLQRARLHIRGGKRRLRQGKIAAGIVTLYDAVSAAMEFYAASAAARGAFNAARDADLTNDKTLYAELVRSGALDGSFDFDAFDRLTESALQHELPGYDYHGLVEGIESLMLQLGVTPFDESTLPPEDPSTF